MFSVCVCFSVFVYRKRPCDELITRPRRPTECLRTSKPESFMEGDQGQNWGCSAKGEERLCIERESTVQDLIIFADFLHW
jgi:hypothetical protein